MRYAHQTVSCPNCGKDTYESLYSSFFISVKCPHCKQTFKYDTKSRTYVLKEKIMFDIFLKKIQYIKSYWVVTFASENSFTTKPEYYKMDFILIDKETFSVEEAEQNVKLGLTTLSHFNRDNIITINNIIKLKVERCWAVRYSPGIYPQLQNVNYKRI